MAQVSIRLSDEQVRRLRKSAEVHGIQFTVYLRELLELGEQIKGASSIQQNQASISKLSSSALPAIFNIHTAVSESRYLIR